MFLGAGAERYLVELEQDKSDSVLLEAFQKKFSKNISEAYEVFKMYGVKEKGTVASEIMNQDGSILRGDAANKAICAYIIKEHMDGADIWGKNESFPVLSEDKKKAWSQVIKDRILAGGYNSAGGFDGIDADTFKWVSDCGCSTTDLLCDPCSNMIKNQLRILDKEYWD